MIIFEDCWPSVLRVMTLVHGSTIECEPSSRSSRKMGIVSAVAADSGSQSARYPGDATNSPSTTRA
jgi:hypothetical protein